MATIVSLPTQPAPTSMSTWKDFQQSKYVHSGCWHFDPFMPKQAWYASLLPTFYLPAYANKHAIAVGFSQSCLGREQTLEGGLHAKVRPKSRLSPRDSVTKKEEVKYLCSCTNHELIPHNLPDISKNCGTSECKTSLLKTETERVNS